MDIDNVADNVVDNDVVMTDITSSFSKIRVQKKRNKKVSDSLKIQSRQFKKSTPSNIAITRSYTIPIILNGGLRNDVSDILIRLFIEIRKKSITFTWSFCVTFSDKSERLFTDKESLGEFVDDSFAVRKLEALEKSFHRYYLKYGFSFNLFNIIPLCAYERNNKIVVTSKNKIFEIFS